MTAIRAKSISGKRRIFTGFSSCWLKADTHFVKLKTLYYQIIADSQAERHTITRCVNN